jgi:hypothetical protein
MGTNRSLQPIRTGISRALSAGYFAKREIPARIKELLAQLRVKEAGPAGASRADPVVQSTGRRPADVVRDGQGRSRLTDAAVRYELIRYLNVLGEYLPDWLCRAVKWLRKPERFFVRLLVSFALIAGGALSFLPVLGLWMLPLGLIIVSQDLVFLQRPLVRTFHWIERKWHVWRR